MHACQECARDDALWAERRGNDPRIARPAARTLHSRRRALRGQDFQTIGVTAMQKLRLLSATLALVAVAAFPAQPADDVKPPPAGYRHWFHVNTMIIDKASLLFADLGGMHNVYVNSV